MLPNPRGFSDTTGLHDDVLDLQSMQFIQCLAEVALMLQQMQPFDRPITVPSLDAPRIKDSSILMSPKSLTSTAAPAAAQGKTGFC